MERQLGNYLLTRLLGRGGFADVYYGEHISLKTPAAIKVLNVQITGDEHEKFLTEAQTVARLAHPHIIAVLEFGVEDDTPYLVMDYAANGTLRQRYPKGTQLAPAQVAPYTEQIASALQYAHSQNLIHHEVKPENMLLDSGNEILVSDFGIALVVQNAQRTDDQQSLVGTIAYMAPEQLRGEPCPASDQYALGAVTYEWLCGEPPFYGSFTEVAIQHALVPPVPLRKRNPQLPAGLEEVVMIALAKEPQARFRSIKAFANAFGQACATEQEAAAPVPPDPALAQPATVEPEEGAARPKKRLSRRTFAMSLGLLGGAGLLAGSALAWKPLTQKRQTLLPATPTPLPHPKPSALAPGTTLYTYHGHPTQTGGMAISWSSDSKRIASASDNVNVQIWYAMTGKLDKTYRIGPYGGPAYGGPYIRAMTWSPNNKYIAVEILQGASMIQVWETSTGQSVYVSHQAPSYQLTGLAWSPDSALIASSGFDPARNIPTIQVWKALTGDQLVTYQGHTSTINSLTWSPDGKLIASADGNNIYTGGPGTVHVWEVATGQARLIYHGHPDAVAAVAWSPDGQLIASGGGSDSNMQASDPNDNTVQLWKPDSDKPVLIYHGHTGPVKTVSWSPNSKFVVSGSVYNSSPGNAALAQVWNAASGQTLLSYQGHNHQGYAGVTAVAWSPDGELIASAGLDATVQVWRAIE